MKFSGPTRTACVIVCLTAMLLGCGQKGPLTLPDAPKHKRALPKNPSSAPATPPATPSP